jgi:diguanylate cyclase (GGDEF)-like protein
MSVLMIDIDQFKQVNDRHSHATGDQVIKSFAMTISCELRKVDHFGRIGGDEFSAILVETSIGQAMDTAERIRRIVEGAEVQFGEKTIQITASLGIAEVESGDAGFGDALARADIAMYQAKKAGRNCIRCS